MPQDKGGAREPGPEASAPSGAPTDASPLLRALRERPPLSLPASTLPLAQGELSQVDAAELAELKKQIKRRVGFHCDGYKEKCLRRRIAVRMRARGVHSYADYSTLLNRDAAEYDRLVDALTINVSKFYRNPEVWQAVQERVLPQLYTLPDPVLNVWSAGTASGEEAYTISMLIRDYAASHDESPDRFRIVGTDIDRDSLRFAELAEYTDFAMGDIDPAVQERWFEHDGRYRLRAEARGNVSFGTLDLIRDPYPAGQHLIFCRNVIIYFERSVQEQLFRRFHDALVPGGFLVLGKVEALFGSATSLFQVVANRQRVFRKP